MKNNWLNGASAPVTALAAALATVLFAGVPHAAYADETPQGKPTLSLEFGASLLSVDGEGVVDSLADAGFNEDESKLSLSYEGERWGGAAALKFSNNALRVFYAEAADMLWENTLSVDELFVWIKPFGENIKFQGGVFEDTSGLADYTDDIDHFPLGVFLTGEDGEPFSEPVEMTNAALANGFLAEAAFGPVTAQLLLAPNYSKETAAAMFAGFTEAAMGTPVNLEVNERFFRIGGRLIADIGVGTLSAMVKTFSFPMEIINALEQPAVPTNGTKAAYTTFGAYADLTAVENLGVSLGYTGFMPVNDADGVDNILWSGIDLRLTWTGIEGLSVSCHNNISFARGAEHEWMVLPGADSSFFNLYNAVGLTKELTDTLSVNAELANVYSKTKMQGVGDLEFDELFAGIKLITAFGENAEFSAGLNLTLTTHSSTEGFGDTDESLKLFSIPVGIKVMF